MWLDDISARLVGSKTLELDIPETLPVVIERLENNVDTDFQQFAPKTGLAGRIEPPSVTIYYRHVLFRNSWCPVFRGRLEEVPTGVRLCGRYTLMRWTTVFVLLFVAFFAFVSAAVLVGRLAHQNIVGALFDLSAVLGFGVIFGLFNLAGIAVGRAHIRKLKHLLIDVVYG